MDLSRVLKGSSRTNSHVELDNESSSAATLPSRLTAPAAEPNAQISSGTASTSREVNSYLYGRAAGIRIHGTYAQIDFTNSREATVVKVPGSKTDRTPSGTGNQQASETKKRRSYKRFDSGNKTADVSAETSKKAAETARKFNMTW